MARTAPTTVHGDTGRAAPPLPPLPPLDPGRPAGDQIVAALMDAISLGTLPVGGRLPAIRHLATHLGVNRNTVAHAYRELAERGFLVARFGGGSFAALPPGNAPLAGPATPEPRPDSAGPLDEEALQLRFARRLGGLLSQTGRTPFLSRRDERAINLFQLRPNTDFFPLEKFRACMNTVLRRSGRLLLNYGAPAGYLPLREQIAGRLRTAGIAADPAQILITSGSQQGIDLMARAFLDPGDGVVVESPTYAIALKIFAANGARLIPYAIAPEGVSFAGLEGFRFNPSPKLFYAVPNFQNPTTHTYTVAEKQALLAQVRRAGSLLIEDAYYTEMLPTPQPALAALDTSGRVVHLNTFSKTLVPAVRVGYLMGSAGLVRRLTELKEMTDLSHSLILQAAVAEFMERGYFDRHVVEVRRFYAERMERVAAMLAASLPPEAPCTRPGGGLFVWVDLPPHLDTNQVYRHLRERGVLVAPGTLFHPFAGGRNGLRLCVASETEPRLEQGIALLGQELKTLLSQPPPTMVERDYQATH